MTDVKVIGIRNLMVNAKNKKNESRSLTKDAQLKFLFSAGISLTKPENSENSQLFKIETLPNTKTLPSGAEWNGACDGSCS